jgi:hypothetical protein
MRLPVATSLVTAAGGVLLLTHNRFAAHQVSHHASAVRFCGTIGTCMCVEPLRFHLWGYPGTPGRPRDMGAVLVCSVTLVGRLRPPVRVRPIQLRFLMQAPLNADQIVGRHVCSQYRAPLTCSFLSRRRSPVLVEISATVMFQHDPRRSFSSEGHTTC